MKLWEKSVVWKRFYKIIYQGVQENIVILNVAVFFFGLKYWSHQILLSNYYTFCELNSNIFSAVRQQAKKIQTIFKKYLMKVIHKFTEF